MWILQYHPYDGGDIIHIFRDKEEADLYSSVFGSQGDDLHEFQFSDDLIARLKNKEIWFSTGLHLDSGEVISIFPTDDRWDNYKEKYELNKIVEPSHKDYGKYYIYVLCVADSKESAVKIAEKIRLKYLEESRKND